MRFAEDNSSGLSHSASPPAATPLLLSIKYFQFTPSQKQKGLMLSACTSKIASANFHSFLPICVSTSLSQGKAARKAHTVLDMAWMLPLWGSSLQHISTSPSLTCKINPMEPDVKANRFSLLFSLDSLNFTVLYASWREVGRMWV